MLGVFALLLGVLYLVTHPPRTNMQKLSDNQLCEDVEEFNVFDGAEEKRIYTVEIVYTDEEGKKKVVESECLFNLMNNMNAATYSSSDYTPNKYEIRMWLTDFRCYRFQADDNSFNIYGHKCNFRFPDGFTLKECINIP